MEHVYIPFTNLTGRPLYKYLTKDNKKKKIWYKIPVGKQIFIQTTLSGYE
ncbi:MAG: hypothetical protein ACTSQJ_03480 [Promethearchaeota archaeon]